MGNALGLEPAGEIARDAVDDPAGITARGGKGELQRVGDVAGAKHAVEKLAHLRLRIRYGGTSDANRHLGPVPATRDAFVGTQAHLFR